MSESNKQRRTFTPQYRREAAALVIDTGRSIVSVAKKIGIGEQSPSTWAKAEKQRLEGTGESMGLVGKDERAELARQRAENFELKGDNRFLGNAAIDSNRECNTVTTGRTGGTSHLLRNAREKDNYAVIRMASPLKVARAGYHACAKRFTAEPGPPNQAQRSLDFHVARVLAHSDDVYETPKFRRR